MAAAAPTILATSGGFNPGRRRPIEPGPLIDFAFELAGRSERPRFCYLGTASGDNPVQQAWVYGAFVGSEVQVSHLALFTMPNVVDIRAHLLAQDVIWVGGGSVAGLLAMWRLHGLEPILRECWEAGVVLGGVSAGSICWHVGGTTDSFGPDLCPIDNGLAFLPFANGVHHDAEPQRRPLFQRLIAEGQLPAGYATDDGAGLHYSGQELVEAVSDRPPAFAYSVERTGSTGAEERQLKTRLLAG
ncbi:MAG: peptidase E [Candidatus Dormibacteraeota bacterium]|uniref:Peptidase E n=1 Tax=Candidatus Dormiibacter inghamiae TaxID=3127013 RepID=A0A934KAM1_9BACT|nr:peptidase E [Candidatus Dormibacteraeota bacterium]MBJ7607336.1 peptidase E [Candidatus Dormibacteraeota bacterium]